MAALGRFGFFRLYVPKLLARRERTQEHRVVLCGASITNELAQDDCTFVAFDRRFIEMCVREIRELGH